MSWNQLWAQCTVGNVRRGLEQLNLDHAATVSDTVEEEWRGNRMLVELIGFQLRQGSFSWMLATKAFSARWSLLVAGTVKRWLFNPFDQMTKHVTSVSSAVTLIQSFSAVSKLKPLRQAKTYIWRTNSTGVYWVLPETWPDCFYKYFKS